jgi:hypothetical protein
MTAFDDLQERLAKLEDRRLTLKDLPLEALKSRLEQDLRPDGQTFLLPHTVREDAIGVLPAAHVRKTVNQTLTSGTATALTFGAEDFDTDALADLTTNNDRLIVRTPGLYLVGALVSFAVHATGSRIAWIEHSGTDIISDVRPGLAGDGASATLSTLRSLDKDAYIRVKAYQNSGGDLDVTSARLWATWQCPSN